MLIHEPADRPICFLKPRRIAVSAWIEHVPFGMYLVEQLRPASIVELGTRNGVSYSAFCQAVDWLGLSTRCVAVDSWQGDAHTGRYGPTVLQDLRRHHDPLYAGFSRLFQTTFDEAADALPQASIDLLHIDGFHTYDAARHDFDTWLTRVSPRGVVLFHDIAERGRDFGVWKLWDELARRYPSFAFRHGHGLGVLGVGRDVTQAGLHFLGLSGPQAETFRRFFERRGRRLAAQMTLEYAARSPARLATAIITLGRRLSANLASGT